MAHYPVNAAVQDELNRFPAIKERLILALDGKSQSDLEVVRLLCNVHEHGQLLDFINENLESSGEIGMQLLSQADPLRLVQLLSELFLLKFLGSWDGVNANAAVSGSGKHHDIDLEFEEIQARIEVFSPVEHYGLHFVKLYSTPVFRWSVCPRGFYVSVELVEPTQLGCHAHQITNSDRDLRPWLKHLEREVENWLATAMEEDVWIFDGVDQTFQLKATLRAVYDNPERRCVEFAEPGRSNDIRLFFEMKPEDTACSQVGSKIRTKLDKRQCGAPAPDYLRILILNFSLADDSSNDWFCWPAIARQMDHTVKILAEEVGSPLPFDVVMPARLGYECCFGEAVILDQAREEQIRRLMAATGLDHKCAPLTVEQPPPELVAALRRYVPKWAQS